MKNVASSVAVIFLVALCSMAVQAQSMLKADIPFDFTIGTSHLAAGTYWVESAGMQAQRIRGDNNAVSTFLVTVPMTKPHADPSRCLLKFHRYGSEYFLAEIWAGEKGNQVQPTKREVQLAKTGAAELATVAMRIGK